MDFSEQRHGSVIYQIRIKGLLGKQWSDWLEGVRIEPKGSMTTMTATLAGPSALHGLIVKIGDLGLPLISIKRLDNSRQKRVNTG